MQLFCIKMSGSDGFVSCVSKISCNAKLTTLESTLQQSIVNIKDIVRDFEQLCVESEDYKRHFLSQKDKCESKTCSSSEELKKIIESKDTIIQLVASTLIRMQETKNINILNEAFQILCGEPTMNKIEPMIVKIEKKENFNDIQIKCSPKEQESLEDLLLKEESLSEIEGTPGRISPIIQSKKLHKGHSNLSSDFRDKKKCPQDWSTPQSKAVKLTYPSPTTIKGKGRLRQSRINLVKLKTQNIVDLTKSPELMTRNSEIDNNLHSIVKKESTDNDDTILPSPTSGSTNFPSLLKTASKNSPFKKPPLCLKSKCENPVSLIDNNNIENSPVKKRVEKEESINLLKSTSLMKDFDENFPIKMSEVYDDETNCEITSSLSILQHVDMLEQNQDYNKQCLSPRKRPLMENKNIGNLLQEVDTDSSISLLRRELNNVKPTDEKVIRKSPQVVKEPVYKEPTLRKKTEKRALPGWSCDECKNFYAELYKDNLEMLAKKMDDCSKHRGKNNPVRAKTPEGFWNPRWDVPEDTEEFNRRNNAV